MKNPKILLPTFLLSSLLLFIITGWSQNVAINTTGAVPNASAMLDISSTGKGLLIPRVSLISSTDAATITSPATSLLIFNTNGSITGGAGFYYNSGTSSSPNWVKLVIVDSSGIVQSVTSTGDKIKLERFPMGELSMNGNTTVTNITAANVWTKVAGTTTFSAGNFEFNNGGTNNRLQYAGSAQKMFHIACTISVKATESNQNLKAVLYKNGVALTAGIVQTKMLSSTDIISTAIHVMTDMKNGDYLELWITNTIGADDFTVTEMNLFAMGISMGMD